MLSKLNTIDVRGREGWLSICSWERVFRQATGRRKLGVVKGAWKPSKRGLAARAERTSSVIEAASSALLAPPPVPLPSLRPRPPKRLLPLARSALPL